MIIQLEEWYITNIRKKDNKPLWIDSFSNNDANKSFILLTGEIDLKSMSLSNHLRYLWRFNYKITIDTILKRIDDAKLWEIPQNNILNNFEDIYNYVYKKINNPKVRYIGQLAIYDISLHLVWLWGMTHLMPKDYVYIHALPKRAHSRLVKEGIIKNLTVTNGMIKTTEFKPYFPNLNAYEIEDLLCTIGKVIRMIVRDSNKVNIANITKALNMLVK